MLSTVISRAAFSSRPSWKTAYSLSRPRRSQNAFPVQILELVIICRLMCTSVSVTCKKEGSRFFFLLFFLNKNDVLKIQLLSNFNSFGTMKICSRQWKLESLRVYCRARSGGIIRISFRFSSV